MTQSKRGRERRARILEAAQTVMLRAGLRGATMEAIARESEIAKATLYSYFPDKEAIYAAIIEMLVTQKRAAFLRGMDHDGPIAEKVGNALAGKLGVVADLLAGSPHAEELLNEHHRLAAGFKTLDDTVEAELTQTLAANGIAQPEMTARMLLAAAYGIVSKFRDPAEVRAAIRLLAARTLGEPPNQ